MMRFPASLICLTVLFGIIATAEAGEHYPDLTGIWSTDDQKVAFARTHELFSDQMIDVEQEIEVYRQEGNLLWVEHRWRRDASAAWSVEYATGAFMPDSDDEFVLGEIGPPPLEGSATNTFFGKIEDGDMHLIGIGNGLALSSVLQRKAQ